MNVLLVPTGDPAGVGPLVAVRAAAERADRMRIVLFGDAVRLEELLATHGAAGRIEIVDTGRVSDEAIAARGPTAEGGRAQLAALDAAIDRALSGEGAIVTAPTSKAAVEKSGTPFTGQTEHLARRAGLAEDTVTMMFLGPRLKVALATTHLAISAVPEAIRSERVVRATVHLVEALARLGVERPRLAVGGLNPHAGEGGLFGREELDVIAPAVERARALAPHAVLSGPLGAESAMRYAAEGEVDGVVAMFHDQATIASKLLDWGAAVNVTWGLPFVRTSADHGVAYDAAARGSADAAGMGAALELAFRLSRAR